MAEFDCRFFGGYKPCARSLTCARDRCAHFSPVGPRVLLVHLGALGAVVRSTSLIPAVRRLYPNCVITWVTKAPAHAFLTNVVDRVLTLKSDDLLALSALDFDVALVVDKDLTAAGVLKLARAREVRGFVADDRNGAITPATPAARELWNLGLSNHDKFFVNQKSEQRLTHEALELGAYARDEYQLHLDDAEVLEAARRRLGWGGEVVIGLNTGCSPALPAKKLSVDGHRELIEMILRDRRFRNARLVLLGGPEDTERNLAIAAGLPVIQSPTESGLRDGLISVAACDLVFSGDSLGMHMAIALKKWVVAWFGPSCAHEIDLYERGQKIMTKAPCAPCWKRSCGEALMCYDQVDFFDAVEALAQGLKWLTSSSKPLFPETSSSPSP